MLFVKQNIKMSIWPKNKEAKTKQPLNGAAKDKQK